jgi:hypothetical protein
MQSLFDPAFFDPAIFDTEDRIAAMLRRRRRRLYGSTDYENQLLPLKDRN